MVLVHFYVIFCVACVVLIVFKYNLAFHALGVASKSMEKICAQWRISSPHGKYATDPSKAMILVLFLFNVIWNRCYACIYMYMYVVFCIAYSVLLYKCKLMGIDNLGLGRDSYFFCYRLLVLMWFLFMGVPLPFGV